MRWTAVINPVAGRGRTRRNLAELTAALTAADVEVVVSEGPHDPPAIARDAAGRGHGIVACGGDGLVAVLAGVAAESDVPFAVVPTGAGNDFARAIGLHPRRPFEALSCIRHGRERRIDLGRISRPDGTDATWFTSIANAGFDAEANRWANTVDRLSGTALYLAAIARTIATYRPQHFRITVDGAEPTVHTAWLVALANTPTYAGGMRIAAGARVDDGLLDLTMIGAVPRAVLLANLPRVATGSVSKHPRVTTTTARHFLVEGLDDRNGEPLELYASGELVGPLPRVVEVVPGALRVMVPPRG